jgi:hypothetical protein
MGAASAVGHASQKLPAPQSHAEHHDHGAMKMAAAADQRGADHCDRKAADDRRHCCDDKGACAQTCLQKCFGQLAVLPLDRATRAVLRSVTAPKAAERPPGWSSAPQLPPPRA